MVGCGHCVNCEPSNNKSLPMSDFDEGFINTSLEYVLQLSVSHPVLTAVSVWSRVSAAALKVTLGTDVTMSSVVRSLHYLSNVLNCGNNRDFKKL